MPFPAARPEPPEPRRFDDEEEAEAYRRELEREGHTAVKNMYTYTLMGETKAEWLVKAIPRDVKPPLGIQKTFPAGLRDRVPRILGRKEILETRQVEIGGAGEQGQGQQGNPANPDPWEEYFKDYLGWTLGQVNTERRKARMESPGSIVAQSRMIQGTHLANLKRLYRSAGIDDWAAEVDGSISYEENKHLAEEKYGAVFPSEEERRLREAAKALEDEEEQLLFEDLDSIARDIGWGTLATILAATPPELETVGKKKPWIRVLEIREILDSMSEGYGQAAVEDAVERGLREEAMIPTVRIVPPPRVARPPVLRCLAMGRGAYRQEDYGKLCLPRGYGENVMEAPTLMLCEGCEYLEYLVEEPPRGEAVTPRGEALSPRARIAQMMS